MTSVLRLGGDLEIGQQQYVRVRQREASWPALRKLLQRPTFGNNMLQ